MSQTVKYFAQLLYHSYLTPNKPDLSKFEYPDLTNQKWLITGATGGIGLEVSRILLKQHAELWIVGRNKEKLDVALTKLQTEFPKANIHTVLVDYNDLQTIKPGLSKLLNETKKLDGIIHNAGVMFVPKEAKTRQGFEQTTGVNNLATQLVQDIVDKLIVNEQNGRIVWLSSIAHAGAPKHGFDEPTVNYGSKVERYCLSKALDYIMAVQWSLKNSESKVKSVVVHPGIIKSDLTRHTPAYRRKLIELFQFDTIYGAETVAYAALNPKVENNEYIVPFGRPGLVRPDIKLAARGEKGAAAMEYIRSRIKGYKN